MRAAFDVLQQPWVPVLDRDGNRAELGLMELFRRAHQLRRVCDPSPLVEYSVFRFLIIFLMDALRPETEEDLEDLLDEGAFPMDRLEDYVAQCREEGVSFDLFHPQQPFLQTAYRKEWDRKAKPVSTLDYTIPRGNNHIHFDHCRRAERYSPGKALRMLLEAQMFCTSGAQGYPSNVSGAPPWYAVITGENLFESLVCSMIPTDAISLPFDQPAAFWQSDLEVTSKLQIVETSWLYGMLFPARRIHLIPEEDGMVSQIYLSQGMNYVAMEAWVDPHVTYRYNNKGRSNWKPSGEKAVWQNLNDLLTTHNGCAPRIFGQYRRLRPERSHVPVTLYGVQTNQASYISVRRQDFALPCAVLGNENAILLVAQFIETAERLGKSLMAALGHSEIGQESRLQARQRFYSLCEGRLWPLLDRLGRDGTDLNQLIREEKSQMCSMARSCVNWTLEQLHLRGKTMLQVMALQKRYLNPTIRKIEKEGQCDG